MGGELFTMEPRTMKSGAQKMFAIIFGGAIALYILYCGMLFFAQRGMLFAGVHAPAPPPPTVTPAGMERIWLETASGKVEAWFIPATRARQGEHLPLIIFAHGNAELIDDWPEHRFLFRDLNLPCTGGMPIELRFWEYHDIGDHALARVAANCPQCPELMPLDAETAYDATLDGFSGYQGISDGWREPSPSVMVDAP